MIAPEFRNNENLSLMQPAQTFISFNYGDGLWNDLQHDLQNAEQVYNQLPHAAQHKTNTA